jgi:hypothetical protein
MGELPSKNQNILCVSVNSFLWIQFSTVTILTFLGLFYYIYIDNHSDDIVSTIFEVFDVGDESSIPTLFSVVNLLVASVLSFIIYFTEKNRQNLVVIGWLALSIVLLLLSIDEGAEIHERAGTRFLEFTTLDIPLINDHKWLLAGGLVTLVVAPLFIPFLLQLDGRTRLLLILSGAIFLGGALGLEFVGAWMLHEHGYEKSDLVYHARRVMEEAFEMYGIALLNCTLLGYLHLNGTTLTLATAGQAVTASGRSAERGPGEQEFVGG